MVTVAGVGESGARSKKTHIFKINFLQISHTQTLCYKYLLALSPDIKLISPFTKLR